MTSLTMEQQRILRDIIDKAVARNLLDRSKVDGLVRDAYIRGIHADRPDLQVDIQFLPNDKAIALLQDYTFSLVKGLNDDARKTLGQELQRALLNNLGPEDVAKALVDKLDIYQARARTIARTELVRAENYGHVQFGIDAQKAGVAVMKEWFNPAANNEKCPTHICPDLVGQRVGMEENFTWKGQSIQAPPAHPNCRCRVLIVQANH